MVGMHLKVQQRDGERHESFCLSPPASGKRSALAPAAGVTGVILAGGRSSRMGSNKALLPFQGGRFIEAIFRQLRGIFGEVLLVTNTPEQYHFLACRKEPDLFPGCGALAGLHAGLVHSRTPYIFAVACDMPYLNDSLIRKLVQMREGADIVIAHGDQGLEPLHALYGKGCLPAMERALVCGRRRVVSFFNEVRVHTLSRQAVAGVDAGFTSFKNINTPEDYFELRQAECEASESDLSTASRRLS